jgi:hypothetical protein
MDGQMRLAALVVGLAFVIGAATLLMTSDLFTYTPVGSLETLSRDMLPEEGQRTRDYRPRARTSGTPTTQSPSTTSVTQLQQVRLLLEKKDRELDAYRKQIKILNDSLSSTSRPNDRPAINGPAAAQIRTVSQSSGDTVLQDDLAEQIDRLNQLLLEADIDETEYRERINTLEDSLGRAKDQLELLQEGVDSEITASDLQQRNREQAMAELVIKTGPDSIPLLIQMLDNNDPRVRSWAAGILGDFGDEAEEAIDALSDLTDDRSIEVRNTARRAMDSIRGR